MTEHDKNINSPEDFSKYCRAIPDFPKKGILFRDITPLLKDSKSLREIIAHPIAMSPHTIVKAHA